jgi:hypothetical protein
LKTLSAFELALFYTTPAFVQAAVAAGVDSVVIDWENRNKSERQTGFNTQINAHSVEDLKAARHATTVNIICRVNGWGEWTPREVEAGIANGADEILLPMVRHVDEINRLFDLINGRCGVAVMIETCEALNIAGALSQLPIRRAYIGLHDLAIDRHSAHLFVALADGTVEQICNQMKGTKLGFAGLTLPDKGSPLPCRLIIGEMARLNTSFSFLRRSFMRDTAGKDLQLEVPRIRQALVEARARSADQVEADRIALIEAVNALPPNFWRT